MKFFFIFCAHLAIRNWKTVCVFSGDYPGRAPSVTTLSASSIVSSQPETESKWKDFLACILLPKPSIRKKCQFSSKFNKIFQVYVTTGDEWSFISEYFPQPHLARPPRLPMAGGGVVNYPPGNMVTITYYFFGFSRVVTGICSRPCSRCILAVYNLAL